MSCRFGELRLPGTMRLGTYINLLIFSEKRFATPITVHLVEGCYRSYWLIVNENVVDSFSTLVTLISPPNCSMIDLAIARPSP